MDRTLLTTLATYTFALLLTYLLFTILSPFLPALVWAAAIGIITYPLYEKLIFRCRCSDITAALLMTSAIVLAVILPLIGLIFALSQEAKLAYQFLESASTNGPTTGVTHILQHPVVAPWLEKLQAAIGPFNIKLDAILLPTVKQGIASLLNYSTGLLKDFFRFMINLVLLVVILFFIYKDGQGFLRRFCQLIAIDERLKTSITTSIKNILVAVIYGIVLTCLVQGTMGGLGFLVVGLPSPLLFGALMVICAVIPVVGTALIWLPGALYLLANGQTLTGIGLIAWGILAVSSIDNIIRPLFISGKAKLPILVIALGGLGGFLAFGLAGVVVGPLILALIPVLLEAYRHRPLEAAGEDV
jgi:predicted PurR-regulated permease PerM